MIECYFTSNKCMTSEKQNIKPIGIIVHSTGANNDELKRYVQPSIDDKNYDYLIEVLGKNKNSNSHNRSGSSKSMHYYIGRLASGEVEIVKTIPHNMACWGCGKGSKGSYNYEPNGHIQFEVCEDNLKSSEYFNECYEKIIQLCADICEEENLSSSSILSHKEAHIKGYASNHKDIDHWFKKYGKTMNDLRVEVENEISSRNHKYLEFEGIITINGKQYEVEGVSREL